MSCRGQAVWGHSEKAALCQSGNKASLDINPVGTLILNFHPPRLGENEFLLLKLPGLCCFLMRSEWPRVPPSTCQSSLTCVTQLACQVLVASFPLTQRHPRNDHVFGIIMNSNSRPTVSTITLQRKGGGVKHWVTWVMFWY